MTEPTSSLLADIISVILNNQEVVQSLGNRYNNDIATQGDGLAKPPPYSRQLLHLLFHYAGYTAVVSVLLLHEVVEGKPPKTLFNLQMVCSAAYHSAEDSL